MSKFQPVANSLILHSLLRKLAARYIENQQVVAPAMEQEGAQQKLKKALETYVLRPIKEEAREGVLMVNNGGGGTAGAAAGQLV